MAKFGVLGPLTIEGPPGHWPVLRGERQRALLAVLLLNAGEHVGVGALVDAIWPDSPPKSHVSNLYTYVSRLRERIDGLRVEYGPRGYRLDATADELDLLAFRAAVADGRLAARSGDLASASVHFRNALAQWRGPVLGGQHPPLLDAQVARLESERLAVFEDCVDAELSGLPPGRHGELTGELQAMITEHPLRERLAAQLMTALHRAGRQGDSLAVYQRLRATLVEQLGVEPGAEARRVHAAVLRGEDPVPRQATTTGPHWPICQLPPDIGDFAGRGGELAELSALLGEERGVPVVLISGEPGAGKSTLAVRAAHQLRAAYPDGQLFVPLSGTTSPREIGSVLTDLLGTLGVAGSAVPEDEKARAAMFRGRLTDRRVLVVLDDVAEPEQARALLPGTPGSAVLITSRRRLSALEGAYRLTLGPFSDADATTLLRALAGAARVGGAAADAARIVAACGNLPLALRIAGSRLAVRPLLPLGKLADRLEDEVRKLDELTMSDLEVRGSIGLSYRGLRPRTQQVFRRIGWCRSADLPGWAVTTLIDDEDVDTPVEELIETSLLEPVGLDATGEPRYRMHDLVKAYATGIDTAGAAVPGERMAAVRSLVAAAVYLADAAAAKLPRTVPMPDPVRLVPPRPLPEDLVTRLLERPEAWFATERANLINAVRVVCSLGWLDEALLLIDRLSVYLYLHGHHADMRAGYRTLLDAARDRGEADLAAIAAANLALLRHSRGEYEEAAVQYRECAKEFEELGDRLTHAWVSANFAHCLLGLGRAEEALRTVEHAHELYGGDGSDAWTSALIRMRGAESAALHRLGRVSDAAEIDRGTVALAGESADPCRLGPALEVLSWSLLLTGRTGEAAEAAGESVRLLRPTAARAALARSLRTRGAVHARLGDRVAAVADFEEARELAKELTDRPRELSCTRAIAASWIGEGRAARAVPVLRACVDEFRAMGGRPAAGLTLDLLGRAYEVTGDGARARAAREAARELAEPNDANAAAVRESLFALA
ncbi:AfsR/SARP family transcriptional regulator [Amycolatopsis sp. CA-230715]|uniref:AfsR/SARP family transcriptional regulator n=1 Tax=Amycolatopsis sp. CA-230715 TaxID=2745196 RepID=UPI001C02856A|nr:BTAD domain-containing putative transcriptional regulator [Amycolatopsis sp. CA-230715]QWF82230.1 hypothetical protein HUW46_05667 [Amycolatopsis sp. CA-230715]